MTVLLQEVWLRALVLIMSGIGTILTAALAQAQTYDPNFPICLQSCALGGCKIECDYTSLAQCNASASGRAAQCYTNPFFALGYRKPPRRSYRRQYR
jgi:hypothetical protein